MGLTQLCITAQFLRDGLFYFFLCFSLGPLVLWSCGPPVVPGPFQILYSQHLKCSQSSECCNVQDSKRSKCCTLQYLTRSKTSTCYNLQHLKRSKNSKCCNVQHLKHCTTSKRCNLQHLKLSNVAQSRSSVSVVLSRCSGSPLRFL